MKLKSKLALLVVFTLIMTSMVCSAAVDVSTTTAYGADGLTITTSLTGVAKDSMVAYAIYGTGSVADSNGSITNSSASGITVGTDDKTNILYLDQQTAASDGNLTFSVTKASFNSFVGSKIKLGSSNSADQTTLSGVQKGLENGVANYGIKAGNWYDTIEYVNVKVTGAITYSYNLYAEEEIAYVPYASQVTITVFPKIGYAVSETSAGKLGDTSFVSGVAFDFFATASEYTLTLAEPTKLATVEKWLSVQNPAKDAEDNKVTVLMNNATDKLVGVDLVIKNGDSEIATVEGLTAYGAATGETAASGYCGVIVTLDSSLINDSYTYIASPYYYDGTTKSVLGTGTASGLVTTYSLN